MFGHYHVADYDEAILLPGALQDTQKQVTAPAAVKLRTAPITTAGYKVQVVPTIPALQTWVMESRLTARWMSVCEEGTRCL
jgi:hypothetical protein